MAKVEHWLCMMLEAGVAADILTYTTVIKAYAVRAEHWMSVTLKAGCQAHGLTNDG